MKSYLNKVICLLTSAGFSFFSSAQRLVPDVVPPEYRVDVTAAKKQAAAYMQTHLLSGDDSLRYLEIMGHSRQEAIGDGNVYYNWPEAEAYANRVLQVLAAPLPEEQRSKLHIYIARDGYYNAFAMADGTILLNVSVFHYLSTEAQLAALLAHELAHYVRQHSAASVHSFIVNYDPVKNYTESGRVAADYFAVSRRQEWEADSIGLGLFLETPYSLEGATDEMEKMLAQEETFNRFREYRKQKKYLTTHPRTQDRLDFVRRFVAASKKQPDERKDFVVSEEEFSRIKKEADVEISRVFLKNGDVHAALETSFLHYLQHPDDNSNIAVLLDAIRKYCFPHKKRLNEYFISELYAKKGLLKQSIMRNLEYFFPKEELGHKIMAKDLLEHPALVATNAGAFAYFSDIAMQRDIHEAWLPVALWNRHSKTKFAGYLQKYISYPDVQYREYATYLLGKLTEKRKRTGKTLLVLSDFSVYGYFDNGYYHDYEREDSMINALNARILKTFSRPRRPYTTYNLYARRDSALNLYIESRQCVPVLYAYLSCLQQQKPKAGTESLLYYDPYLWRLLEGGEYDQMIIAEGELSYKHEASLTRADKRRRFWHGSNAPANSEEVRAVIIDNSIKKKSMLFEQLSDVIAFQANPFSAFLKKIK